jgi:hypothetical protein
MAAKKRTREERTDRHKSAFVVRLPLEYRDALRRLRRKNRRTYTSEVKIALEEHFKREGIEFTVPDDDGAGP